MRHIGIIAAVIAMGLFAACEQPKDEEADKPAADTSADAPSASHSGEPPSPNQPQPVYPDGAPQ